MAKTKAMMFSSIKYIQAGMTKKASGLLKYLQHVRQEAR